MKKSLKEVIYKGNRNFWNVAKPVRHQILTLEITGSNPVIPAKNKKRERKPVYYVDSSVLPNYVFGANSRNQRLSTIAKLVRHQILTLESIGSSSIIPAKI